MIAQDMPAIFDLRAIRRWVGKAKAGERIIYGRESLDKAVATEARTLLETGAVALNFRKGQVGEYIMTRREGEPTADVAPASLIEDVDDALARVMKHLRRAANFERACPSNVELARLCGLKDADAAAYLVRKAVSYSLIRVEDRRPKRRVVQIVATGRRTLED
jgi:hypothetical protein